jgi:hypothetical protein
MEHRLLRNQLTVRVRLRDGERRALAAIGQKLGQRTLREVATILGDLVWTHPGSRE